MIDAIENMKKEHRIADAVNNARWYKFIDCMRYKCEHRGIEFKQVPRNYPSSKTCSRCGFVHRKLKIDKDRRFICPECGYNIDRDINAATNLMNYYK